MIRNILYSLFFHFLLISLVYFSFNSDPIIDLKKPQKVSVSLVLKSGNVTEQPVLKEIEKLPSIPEPPAELNPEIEKQLKKEEEKKAALEKERLEKIKKEKLLKEKLEKEKKAKIEKEKLEKEKKAKIEKEKKKKIEEEKLKKKKAEEEKSKKEEVKKEPEKQLVKEEPKPAQKPTEVTKEEPDIFSQNTIDKLSLLARERINLQSQFDRCYFRALKKMNIAEAEPIRVKIFIDKNGLIDLDLAIFENFDKKWPDPIQENYRIAVKTARIAILFCNPMHNLPSDKYDIWKEIDLEFGFKNNQN